MASLYTFNDTKLIIILGFCLTYVIQYFGRLINGNQLKLKYEGHNFNAESKEDY